MWLDIAISAGLAILTILMAYLGVHVTLHPADTPQVARRYKQGFLACAACAVALVIWQGVRNGTSQATLNRQIADSTGKVAILTGQVATLQADQNKEVVRRQQAEKDLATIVQNSGKSTADGIVSGVREISRQQALLEYAVSVDVLYQENQIKIYNRGKHNILLWGTQLADLPKDFNELSPRSISPSGNNPLGLGDNYYYIYGDRLEKYLLNRFGRNGEGTVPLNLFIEDQLHNKHTVKGLLSVHITKGSVKIDTQNLGTISGW